MTWLLQVGHTRRLLNTSMYLSMLFGRHRLLSEKKESFLPDTKWGRTILSKIQQSVKLFYEDNEYSRLMSGVKDYVNVGSKVHKQTFAVVQSEENACHMQTEMSTSQDWVV